MVIETGQIFVKWIIFAEKEIVFEWVEANYPQGWVVVNIDRPQLYVFIYFLY